MSELQSQVSLQPQQGATAPTVVPPSSEPVAEPTGTVDVGGQRLAPVSAVIEERQRRQEASRERDALKAENETLRKAAENWKVVEPYVPLLASHPKVTGKPEPQSHAPAVDPEHLELAKTLGFYDDAGQPDIDRARRTAEILDRRTTRTVETSVQPVAQTAHSVQAHTLRERAYTITDKAGRPFAERQHIDAVLNQLTPQQAANAEIVNMMLLVARGMGTQPAGEPLHTEGPGGSRSGPSGLSPMERAAAKSRGMTEDQWVKVRDNNSNVLE